MATPAGHLEDIVAHDTPSACASATPAMSTHRPWDTPWPSLPFSDYPWRRPSV